MKINYIKLPSKSNEIIISAVFNAGKIFAPKKYPELPHLVEHMIANKLLQYNYKYEAVVDTEKCTFNIYIPKENPLKKITGFFEMLFGTTKFDEHELNTEKGIIKKE
ncbi:MAG: hypothetical protein NTW79_02310, partial [Candidatus Berkelbacteria bacterium]|nr:hypothetical protein [Candidatus Berkelbacteria bacterium]